MAQSMETIFNIEEDNEESVPNNVPDSVSENGAGHKEVITCRICHDGDNKECILTPCNCVGSHAYIHESCLERWMSVSESSECDICKYTFKTVSCQRSLFECLSEKKSCQEFSSQIAVLLLIFSIWLAIVIILGIKTYGLLGSSEKNLFLNELALFSIAITISIMLIFWAKDFYKICITWREANTVIRLDKDYLERNNTIGTDVQ